MIVGIDLGTTNSAVGVWRDGRAELIPNSLGSVLTPSAVSIDEHGELLVGLAARERQVTHPNLTATAFKRYMGSQRATRLGKRSFLPEDLSALVLRNLKADAERFLGEPVTDAVITVPAYFNDRQRKATRRAGQLAGLTVDRLLNEPTAAALAYGIHRAQTENRFLVFDLGGGTFDVSILELFEGIIEVRASTGDNRLGGEDFNDVLIQLFTRAHRSTLGDDAMREGTALFQHIRDQAERCRRKLSKEDSALMQVIWNGQSYELQVSVEEFEKASDGLLERLRRPVLQAIRDSSIKVDSLDEIVLVGGATRMPIVRRTVTKMFGRFPAAHVHPDEAVAIGAAIQAGLKARDAHLREVVLTDICPYTLGIETSKTVTGGGLQKGLFTPIIERSTIVPASRERAFTTVTEGQTKVEFSVYQGESRRVEDNIPLGKISIPVPQGRPGEVQISCRFTYDINGILEVDLHVPATGQRRQLVIVDDPDSMTPEELEKRQRELAAIKVHPRDMDGNRALLARLERCYEQSLGPQRTMVGEWISKFITILDSQEPRTIADACAKLTAMMDSLEGETLL
jgi:molecular chaperone HscC